MKRSPHVLVHCMDHRIQDAVENLADFLGIKKSKVLNIRVGFNRLSVAGGAAHFRELRAHLKTATKLHGCRSVILTVHNKCGAGAKKKDLQEAARIAIRRGYTPRMFFIFLNGKWKEVFLEKKK